MLPYVTECRRALIVGDGDGRFLDALLRQNAHVEVDSVDVSPGMIALARRRIAALPDADSRVRFTIADVRSDPLPGTGYDLLVTNFVLDCFTPAELAGVIDRLTAVATPSARWVVGDFGVPAGRWRPAGLITLAGMYAFFRIVTGISASSLVNPSPLLTARGWVATGEATWLAGFLCSRLWIAAPESGRAPST